MGLCGGNDGELAANSAQAVYPFLRTSVNIMAAALERDLSSDADAQEKATRTATNDNYQHDLTQKLL